MLGRLLRTAPALGAILLCGCSLFAGAPPRTDVAEEVALSLKDAWQATSTQVVVRQPPAAASATPPRQTGGDLSAASCKTDRECILILSALLRDPKRGWIGQPQTAAEYANGTRFFAYRALRRTLSCRQLHGASRDLTTADKRLSPPSAGVSAAQAVRAISLLRAVASELRREIAGRCSAAPPLTQAQASAAAGGT